MSELEKQEVISRIKGMTQEEQQLAIKVFPSEVLLEEVIRRDEVSRRMLSDIRNILKV